MYTIINIFFILSEYGRTIISIEYISTINGCDQTRRWSGLTHEMYCIFFGYRFIFQIPLHIYWDTSDGFEKISFVDLFEKSPKNIAFIDKNSWNILRNKETRTLKLDEKISCLSKNYMFSNYPLEHLFLTRKPFRMTAVCNRDLQTTHFPVLQKFIPSFTTQYIENARSFQPQLDIRKMVACGVQAWGGADVNVLGVHIRRNDALLSKIGNKFTKPTNTDILDAIHKHLKSTHTCHVFVSTDDPAFFQTITEEFASEERVHWYTWNHYNHALTHEKGGQKKALVDLTTLRFCNKIIGTTVSAFQKMETLKLARTIALHSYSPNVPRML